MAPPKKTVPRRMLLDSDPTSWMKANGRVIGFEFKEGVFVANPWILFLPKGLIIWGAPPHSTLDQCLISNVNCVQGSHVGIPTEFFTHWKSYAEIAKGLDDGVEPVGWCSYHSIMPGCRIHIIIRAIDGIRLGPTDGVRLAMWGIGYV